MPLDPQQVRQVEQEMVLDWSALTQDDRVLRKTLAVQRIRAWYEPIPGWQAKAAA